jgi:hypothetical protein
MDLGTKDYSTPLQKTQMLERRGRLERAFARLRGFQKSHTPLALTALPDTEEENMSVEAMPLLLPSDLPEYIRLHHDMVPWVEMESDFRRGQLETALSGLRRFLFVKTRLHTQRALHARGQNASTRARAFLATNDRRIAHQREKFRAAWDALRTLLDDDDRLRYPYLRDEDCRALHEVDPAVVLGKRPREDGPSDSLILPGASRTTISWIWMNVDVEDDSEAMVEATRIEWSKAWARMRRWTEEVEIIAEEMRRVLVSLRNEEKVWQGRVTSAGTRPEDEGKTAYALRQAAIRSQLASKFFGLWKETETSESGAIIDTTPALSLAFTGENPHNPDDIRGSTNTNIL